MIPHFLGIGAQKAGTSWLAANLMAHPQIWLPPIKELHYFDGLWNVGNISQEFSNYLSQVVLSGKEFDRKTLEFYRRYVLEVPKNDQWYRSLFKEGQGKICGEITPEYAILSKDKIQHVHRISSNAKLIYILRDPIDRAWSHFRFDADRHKLNIHHCSLATFQEHFDAPHNQNKCLYTQTIQNWISIFSQDNLLVLFFEDIKSNPLPLLERVCGFLGVTFSADYFRENLSKIVNKGTSIEINLPCSNTWQQNITMK